MQRSLGLFKKNYLCIVHVKIWGSFSIVTDLKESSAELDEVEIKTGIFVLNELV